MQSTSSLLRHIPNGITCLNLFCGCLSIIHVFENQLTIAVYFIFAAAVLDFFDGFVARLLKAYSNIGKELDSLADVVSFGVAPSAIMYSLLLNTASGRGLPVDLYTSGWFISMAAFLIAVFSALRLAKFNIDSRQTESFIGLPVPANALFICSLAFIIQGNGSLASFVNNMYFLLAVTLVFSFLLVSELPLFSLKFKSFDWKNNKIRYIFLGVSAVALLLFQWAGLAFVILFYILLSLVQWIFNKS